MIESCCWDQGDLNIGQGCCCGPGGEGHSLLKYECGYYNLMTAAAAPAVALLHTTNYWQYPAVTVKCPPPYMIEIQTQETRVWIEKYTICVFDICLCRLTNKKFHGYDDNWGWLILDSYQPISWTRFNQVFPCSRPQC